MKLPFIVLAIVLLAPAPLVARVSLRIGGNAPVVLEAAGGAVVHAGDYRVNGIEARVEVFAFKDAQPGLAASLLRRFGLEPGAALSAKIPAKAAKATSAATPAAFNGDLHREGGPASANVAAGYAKAYRHGSFSHSPQPPASP